MHYLNNLFQATVLHNRERILQLIRPVRGGSLLDLGCSDGSFTLQVAAKVEAGAVKGVEFVDELVGEARARGVEAITHDLNEPLPYARAEFDVVHSNQVIEHLVRTDAFLREVRRVLKPGGYALLSTNNLASWHNVVSLALGMQPPPCHASEEVVLGNRFHPNRGRKLPKGRSHLRLFSFTGFRELARYHGFRVEELVSSGYYPLPPRVSDFLCRVDPRHGAFLIARLARA